MQSPQLRTHSTIFKTDEILKLGSAMKLVTSDIDVLSNATKGLSYEQTMAVLALNDAPFLAGHSTTIFSKKFY